MSSSTTSRTPSPKQISEQQPSTSSENGGTAVVVAAAAGGRSGLQKIGRFFRNSVKRTTPRELNSQTSIENLSRSSSPSVDKSPQRTRSKKFTGFASRSIRKSQWRLFKHRTFFGSQQRGNSIKKNELQLPRLTLRHPSVDSTAMQLTIDEPSSFLEERRRRKSSKSIDEYEQHLSQLKEHEQQETLERELVSSTCDGELPALLSEPPQLNLIRPPSHQHQSMTAPVSPNIPLSASSTHSDGWKYSSHKLLWKLKPRYINFSSHASCSTTSSSTDSAWKSLDSTTWRSVDGAEVVLRGAQLEHLSEIERSALRLIAAQRLAKLVPGVALAKPKDALSALRQKRQKLVKTNRAFPDSGAQRRVAAGDNHRVFGVSLTTCMLNEKRLDVESRCRSLDESITQTMPQTSGGTLTSTMSRSGTQLHQAAAAKSSVKSEPEQRTKWLYPTTTTTHHTLSAASSIASVARPSFSASLDATTTRHDQLQVPKIVHNCTQYLMAHGLNQVGLFRVAGNTKRCRQLRMALEKVGGRDAISEEMVANTTPHDVATLLKEYFRDLPQSLLPNEHYLAYIGAAKLHIDERIEAIRLLFSLLVEPNLDTLFVLLNFLHHVSLNAGDRSTSDGRMITGNKMDAHNLATIFAPSILRAEHAKLEDTLADSDQRIAVVETMIAHVDDIFKIPKELQSSIYSKLRETEPDRLDRILNHLSKMDSSDRQMLLSPYPATLEEVRVHHHRHSDHSHIGRQSPLAREPGSKPKVQSQRSGSWPYSLTATPPKSPPQRFFPSDEEIEESRRRCSSEFISKSADVTPMAMRRRCTTGGDSGRDSSEFCSDEIRLQNTRSTRSPSRERVDSLRIAARTSAAAARRRLRNVVRAFRLSTRSTPDII